MPKLLTNTPRSRTTVIIRVFAHSLPRLSKPDYLLRKNNTVSVSTRATLETASSIAGQKTGHFRVASLFVP